MLGDRKRGRGDEDTKRGREGMKDRGRGLCGEFKITFPTESYLLTRLPWTSCNPFISWESSFSSSSLKGGTQIGIQGDSFAKSCQQFTSWEWSSSAWALRAVDKQMLPQFIHLALFCPSMPTFSLSTSELPFRSKTTPRCRVSSAASRPHHTVQPRVRKSPHLPATFQTLW